MEQAQSMMVDKYYEMDPQFEDLLFDGALLKIGMVVLIEDPKLRVALGDNKLPGEIARARVTNRWCTIEQVQVDSSSRSIEFIALYEDGIKRKRIYDVSYAWIVKRDSIPPIVDDCDEIVLATRIEAEEIITRLSEVVSKYKFATVSDLYELVGISSNSTDDKRGWTDIHGVSVTKVRRGYLLNIPKPEPLVSRVSMFDDINSFDEVPPSP